MIYFVQPIDGGPVKIGTSVDVDARVRQLEAHYGRPLALLGVVEGGRSEERAIHDRFSHLRFGRTEQFQPAADLMEFIGRPLFVSASPAELIACKAQKTTPVRLSDEAIRWARIASGYTGESMTEYVSRVVAEFARADSERLHAEIHRKESKPRR